MQKVKKFMTKCIIEIKVTINIKIEDQKFDLKIINYKIEIYNINFEIEFIFYMLEFEILIIFGFNAVLVPLF
jgi:hypothetical protein